MCILCVMCECVLCVCCMCCEYVCMCGIHSESGVGWSRMTSQCIGVFVVVVA